MLKISRTNKNHNKKTNKKTKKTTVKHKKIKGGDDINRCSICLDEIKEGIDDIINLTCTHNFHKDCLYDYCKYSGKKYFSGMKKSYICNCPLCRTQLDKNDLEKLGFHTIDIESILLSAKNDQERENLMDDFFSEPPYLINETRFKKYINKKLRAPTKMPIDKLKKELEEFINDNDLSYQLPSDIHDKIMEFELQQITPQLSRFNFIKIVERVPMNISIFRNDKKNKKYYKFNSEIDNDGELYAASLEQL